MTEDIELKPIEESEKEILPETITEKGSSMILDEIYNLLNIYYSANQISTDKIPKQAKWYLNEILEILTEYSILTK